MLRGFFTIELDNREDFGRVMKSLRTIPTVVNITEPTRGAPFSGTSASAG
jgi:hypothetical protein